MKFNSFFKGKTGVFCCCVFFLTPASNGNDDSISYTLRVEL